MNAANGIFTLPTLLVGGLIFVALLTYLLRSWETLTGLVAAVFTGGLGLWLWQLDLSTPLAPLPILGNVVGAIDITAPLTRLGFTFQLQPGASPILVTAFFMTAGAFLLTVAISQGRSFVPFMLVLLAGYVAVTLMTAGPLAPPFLTPIFLVALNSVAVFILQAGRLTNPSGPLRTLTPSILAFPLFLVAYWYIDQIPLNPQDNSAQITAARLLTFGLLLLLMPVPLHSAQPVTAQSAPPVVTALVTLLYQLALLHLLFRVINPFPFVAQTGPFEMWMTWAGVATTVWGGIAAAGSSHPGRLWGYAALHDWGLILMILAVPGLRSWPLALFLFGLRVVSMLTAAAGLAALEQHVGGMAPQRMQGAGNRLPWNSAAFLLGGLGLTGFPLSAGFTGHWTALQIIAENDWRPAAIVLFASVGAIWGFVRLTRILFGPLENRFLLRERMGSVTLALCMLLLSISLAIAPQLLDGPIRSAWAAFSG
ncbi:MAG: proton-conducting transporter membrane subunit [Caldilineaceae bacterium]